MQENLSLEEALKLLETKAALLKDPATSLDESVKIYEECMDIYKYASAKISDAKQKIEIYRPESGTTEDFDEIQ